MVVPSSRARAPRVTLLARLLLAVTAVVVALIVFTPGPPDEPGQRALALWLDRVHQTWMPGWVTFGLIEFAANVLMFLPLGLLGALALSRGRWLVVPACTVFSAAIELAQWLALPERDGSWLDLVANVIGALVGYALARAVLRRAGLRAPPGAS